MEDTSNRSGALSEMRVVDLTQMMAGSYCSAMLADMGADVIKVERVGSGDDTRRFGSAKHVEDSQAFSAMNRNKRGVALDLKDSRAVDALITLIERADVLIENFRPGVMDRLGLGYQTLSARFPALIYCSISGFGATGPYRERGGFDLVAQAMSGLISMTGEPGGRPVKPGVPICDLNAGMYATIGILSSYAHRLRTGRGQFVDTSLLESGIAYTPWETALYFAYGEEPVPLGTAHRLAAPYECLQAADGWLAIGAANERNYAKFCEVIGAPHLIHDERFETNQKRLVNRDLLAPELERHLIQRPKSEWLTELEAAGVPCGPLYELREVYEDPQVQAREMLVTVEHPVQGPVKHIGAPVKLSETPWRIRRPAPLLGQHTREVFLGTGLSDAELDQLVADGVMQSSELPTVPTGGGR